MTKLQNNDKIIVKIKKVIYENYFFREFWF